MTTRHYATTTVSYWALTVTDGALRMLVLLYFHQQGMPPLALASLFLLYEFCGVVTTALGGWWASRSGLKVTLVTGLGLQVVAMAFLALLPVGVSGWVAVVWVMGSQALSGVAKDLTKMSSKSAVKILVKNAAAEEKESKLWKWVAVLTGSKNALKGVGFFLGAYLLGAVGYSNTLWIMVCGLGAVWMISLLSLPRSLGHAAHSSKKSLRASLSKSRAMNWLSTARLFLFAARDVWFVAGLPLYLKSQLGWSFATVGIVMACWVIGYGFLQAIAPTLSKKSHVSAAVNNAFFWLVALVIVATSLAGVSFAGLETSVFAVVLISGLVIYGAIFAMNSALHSYLVLALGDDDAIASDVGFYYMANAWGRLLGTLASGLCYQFLGLQGCLVGSVLLLIMALLSTRRLISITPPTLVKNW